MGQNSTLFVFLDESGNFDFSPRGTKYFVVTAIATFDPLVKRDALIKLRYNLLSQGVDQEFFHASEDRQSTRNAVFEILGSIGNTFEIHSVVAQKSRANPSLYKEEYMKGGRLIRRVTGLGLYQRVGETLLQYVFRGKSERVEKIIVVLGSLFVGDKKSVVLQTLKHFLKQNFSRIPFEIYSHQSCADLNCQFADYCCWAISVRRERAEERPYAVIKPMIKSEFEIFRNGDTEYY